MYSVRLASSRHVIHTAKHQRHLVGRCQASVDKVYDDASMASRCEQLRRDHDRRKWFAEVLAQSQDSEGEAVPAPESAPEQAPADIEEHTDSYHLYIDAPGINVTDAKISVNPERRMMTVAWTRQRISRAMADFGSKPMYKGMYERRMGKFRREVFLARDCDPSTIRAKLENGVLHISAKKRLPTRSISIEVD